MLCSVVKCLGSGWGAQKVERNSRRSRVFLPTLLLLPNATFSSFTYFNVFSLRNSLMYNICKWKVLCFGSPLAQRRLTLLMKTVRQVRKLTFCLNIADLVTIIILFNLTSKVKRHNHTLPIFPSHKKK